MKLPTRGATAGSATKLPAPEPEPVEDAEAGTRAEETPAQEKPATFGAVGIVAAALLLMTIVYYVATQLMK
jgi:hypothetical protein